MAKIRTLQIYRGTTAQNNAYTGSAGELTMDTTTNELRLHDGSTVGGHIIGSGGGGSSDYHPDLFDYKWADHICNDVQWLRADTYSWQDGSVYEAAYNHLIEDVEEIIPAWTWLASGVGSIYTAHRNPAVGDKAYSNTDLTVEAGDITEVTSGSITVNSTVYNMNGHITGNISTETVAGITINYYQSSDGHKIIQYNQITQAEQIYAATGSSWYYILDYMNQRFKLPRAKPLTGGVIGNGMTLGLTDGTRNAGFVSGANAYYGGLAIAESYGLDVGTVSTGNTWVGGDITMGITTDPTKSGIIAERDNTDQYKYLYFYVGKFTQTAIENTAGLNTELFNGKADLNLANVLANIDFVVERQEPTAGNNYTWYRKYRSGWVEQGGLSDATFSGVTVTMPIEMSNENYTVVVGNGNTSTNMDSTSYCGAMARTSTTFLFCVKGFGGNGTSYKCCWRVSGYAAV